MVKVAVITPYYKETEQILRQAHESVLRQTHPCRHFMIADGYPNPAFATSADVEHVTLPLANADNGNTPRAFGGLLAKSYGFDAVAYLDADNWFEPTHIEQMVAEHLRTKAPLIGCKRQFCDLDGKLMPITEPDEDANRHVDTSCWLVFRPAFAMLQTWLMPKQLSPICDRIFYTKALHERYSIFLTNARTVVFRTQYAYHYQLAGWPVPEGAKGSEEFTECNRFLLSVDGVRELVDTLGFYPPFK
jgi:glycosyltransferase involved in cell wall biosynthesis